jgi:hypothetical protein
MHPEVWRRTLDQSLSQLRRSTFALAAVDSPLLRAWREMSSQRRSLMLSEPKSLLGTVLPQAPSPE